MSRNFGLKDKNLAPPRILDGITIYDACAATSERLNNILGTHDIEVRLAGMGDDHIEGNLVGGWLKAVFEWHNHVRPYHASKQSCHLGLFKGYDLCGMCEVGLKVTARKKVSLDILFVEGHPDPEDNPLKGYVIPAFAEASLQIAKASDVKLIGVDRPGSETVHQYKILGYRRHFWDEFKLMKGVNDSAELDWQALLARRRKQGFALAA